MSRQNVMLFFVAEWLENPAVTRCEPATRGILFDWICAIHEAKGNLSGTIEQLAIAGRCTPDQCSQALSEIKQTRAANVAQRAGIVTLTKPLRMVHSMRSVARRTFSRATRKASPVKRCNKRVHERS